MDRMARKGNDSLIEFPSDDDPTLWPVFDQFHVLFIDSRKYIWLGSRKIINTDYFFIYFISSWPLPEVFDDPAGELTEGPHENNKLIMH